MNAPISEEDLHAYADGQLDGVRLTQLESWLVAHPEHREQVAVWRTQSAKLHCVYDAVLDEPIPARLMPAANQPRWFAARQFAAIAWLAVGVLIGFLVRGGTTDDHAAQLAANSLPRRAAIAHVVYASEIRHPVEVGVDQEAHLVAWLSKRHGSQLKPPVLDEAGYQLVGGRLLPGDQGSVAQFMYENEQKSRLTLYVQPNAAQSAEPRFRYASEKGVDVFYWVEGHFGYALSGNTGRENMLKLATLVYGQLAAQ